jgi:IS1 family transposase
MNKLPLAKRVQIISMLCEGSSMRSISRVCDVSINTVTKLLEDAGRACAIHHFNTVRGVQSRRVQCDEIWSFCYVKERNVTDAKAAPEQAGSVWTWTALDADSKLIVSYIVGDRDAAAANYFKDDLQARLAPAHISTSFVERHNLTMRMSMKRFAQLGNAFSKKIDNHVYALALYFTFYNFVRQHKSLRMSPAMAAGISDRLWSMDDIVALIDARAKKPGKRGPYKKKAA